MRYLVTGSEGLGFASPRDAIEVLKKEILPTFDALRKLEAKKKTPARLGRFSAWWRALAFGPFFGSWY